MNEEDGSKEFAWRTDMADNIIERQLVQMYVVHTKGMHCAYNQVDGNGEHGFWLDLNSELREEYCVLCHEIMNQGVQNPKYLAPGKSPTAPRCKPGMKRPIAMKRFWRADWCRLQGKWMRSSIWCVTLAQEVNPHKFTQCYSILRRIPR